jgi:hypothetical protein
MGFVEVTKNKPETPSELMVPISKVAQFAQKIENWENCKVKTMKLKFELIPKLFILLVLMLCSSNFRIRM